MLDEKEWEKSMDDSDSKSTTGLTAASATASLMEKSKSEEKLTVESTTKTLDDRVAQKTAIIPQKMMSTSLISSAAADSPYNQDNATIESVAEEAKKGWL
jgi:hypothetical protein